MHIINQDLVNVDIIIQMQGHHEWCICDNFHYILPSLKNQEQN